MTRRPLPKRGTVVHVNPAPHASYNLTIRSNGVARDLLRYDELTPAEQKDNDWDTEQSHCYVRYQNYVTPFKNFSQYTKNGQEHAAGWDGLASDSFFSGLVVRMLDDERIIVGRCWSSSA